MNPRTKFRRLWTEHVVWTRFVIVSAHSGLQDLRANLDRLLKNQDQIGAAIIPFVKGTPQPVKGEPGRFFMQDPQKAGRSLATLLRTHVKLLAEAITALKEKKAPDRKKLDENADEIGLFLNRVFPSLSSSDAKTMLRDHVDIALKTAKLRFDGNYTGEISEFELGMAQAAKMGDLMAAAVSERS